LRKRVRDKQINRLIEKKRDKNRNVEERKREREREEKEAPSCICGHYANDLFFLVVEKKGNLPFCFLSMHIFSTTTIFICKNLPLRIVATLNSGTQLKGHEPLGVLEKSQGIRKIQVLCSYEHF